MNQSMILSGWRMRFEKRKTVVCAAARLRSMLCHDRAILRSDATKRLNAELDEVLRRYFTVSDLCFYTEPGKGEGVLRYTLEAELVPLV